jgi:hypothetical protein
MGSNSVLQSANMLYGFVSFSTGPPDITVAVLENDLPNENNSWYMVSTKKAFVKWIKNTVP